MQTLTKEFGPCKAGCSERFGALLPLMVEVVEVEWRQRARLMNAEERLLFRQVHQALGTLNEMWDGAP
jgi:hypothetical protein